MAAEEHMVQKHDCLSSQLSYLTILESTLNWVDLFLHRSRCIWTLKDTWRKSQLTPSTQLEDRGVKDLHILVSSQSLTKDNIQSKSPVHIQKNIENINTFFHRIFHTSNSLVSELVSGSVEAVSEEKARKVLDRVDFLTKLREEVVVREDLADVLEEHAELALDLPEWWQPGKHDHDLVVGAAR